MIDIKEEDQHININLVVSLLELTFRAGKDQDRISAELQLCKLSKKTSEMTHILLKIIGSEQYNGNLQKKNITRNF